MAERDVADLTKLDGTNYSMWKFGVVFALKAKDLYGFIDDTEKKPDAAKAAECKAWEKQSSQAAMILLSSVEKSLHCNLINCSSPAEMWKKLQDLYGDTSVDAKQTAWEQFYAFRINESESIAVQMKKLESICKKLDDASEKP